MATVRELLATPAEAVPRRDVEVLLGHCLGKPRAWLYGWGESEVDARHESRFRAMLSARARGEPVAYLTGQREFWSLPLAVDHNTLIPRPETETLVEWALALALPRGAAILDLGTGSGAIALALASERPDWSVTGVDCSAPALAVAERNAEALGLENIGFLRSDWFQQLLGLRYHLVVANPPYVAPDDPHLQQGDVRFEPDSALVARDAGLADLASIARAAPDHLFPEGWLLMEHGHDQGDAVRRLLLGSGFAAVATRRDLGGHERVSGGSHRA
jgi:release factor glutamine methyltransferase